MGYIKQEDIVGYEVNMGNGNMQVVCVNCATLEEKNNAKEKEIIIRPDNAEDDMCFCDRCEEQIF